MERETRRSVEFAMANAKRNGGSAASKMGVKEIPAPSGKENVQPCERRIAARRKLSFSGCEASRRSRVSFAANDEENGEATASLFGQAFAVKKTPFHVHRDERNAPSVSRVAPRQQALRTREAKGSANAARNRLPVCGVDECVDESCPCERPRDRQTTRLSKIPRRSRCASVPPNGEASGIGSRRAVSTGKTVPNGSGSTAAKRTIEIGRAPAAPRAGSIRGVAIKGRLADAAIVAPRRTERAAVSTPLDGASLPPPMPKAVPRAVAKSKTESVRAKVGAKEMDSFPAESAYLAEYREYVALVELEREERCPRPSARFLSGRFNAEQRRLVVAFLLRLGTHCRYPSSVVYQSVKLFDVAMDRIRVETRFVQLTALASLWISLKRQENFHRIPSATTMVDLAKELYAGREDLLIVYERAILCELNFNVTFADPYALFVCRLLGCARTLDASEQTITYLYNCGCYAIDVTMMDEQFCRTSVRLVATTVAELVLGVFFDAVAPGPTNPRWLYWRGLLSAAVPGLPPRFPDDEIDRTRVAVSRRLLNSGRNHDGFEAVYKKYNRSRYGRVSDSFLKRLLAMSATETLFDP